jgi:predicted permease
VTTLLFGLFPALWMARVDPAKVLHSGTRVSAGPGIRRWQQTLLTGQLAMVLVLLVAAGLLLESFRRLMSLNPGYESRPVIALDVNTWGFPTNGDTCRFYRALRERLAALPGVVAVGTSSSAPLTGKWTFDEKPQVVGQPAPEAERPLVAARFVAFDYFQAMAIPLVEGRFFRDSELKDDGYGQIVILNESAAARLFPGRSAVGGRFTVGSNPDRVLEVIGVVKDTRDVRLEEKPRPTFYWQYAFGGAQVLIRGSVPVRALIPLVNAALAQTDPRITSTGDASSRRVNARIMKHTIQPMTEIVSATVAERRFAMTMLAGYALLALGIALVGVLGVVGYQVAQRTNEFGIRLALGALPAHLTRLVLAQAGRLVVLGLSLGLLASLGVTRLLQSQLFGLSPTDPLLLGGVTLLLGGCALLACWLPARGAAKVDPMLALRAD